MSILVDLCAGALAFFFQVGGQSYLVAIGLLTVLVMLLMLPLTIKATRSSFAMQRIAPDMKKLQEQYRNDREKLVAETSKLYKENNVHPMSGCLPMLLQMPILFALYQALMGLTNRTNGVPNPKHLSADSQLYQAIVNSGGKMESLGVDLAISATNALKISFVTAIPFIVIAVLMVVFQYLQMQQMTSKALVKPDPKDQQAQMMLKMQKIMPPFFGLISLSIPAGVVVYWMFSSIFRVGQQELMYRFDPRLRNALASRDAKESNEAPIKPDRKASGRAQQPGSQPVKRTSPAAKSRKKRKGR